MKKILKTFLRRFDLELTRYHPTQTYQHITLLPEKEARGNVLLAYIVDPFLVEKDEAISCDHTHHIESKLIAQSFLNQGYRVDVIDYRDRHFFPNKKYDFFVSARTNLEHIAKRLNDDCIKIAHLDTSHFLFNNFAAYKRALKLQNRRGIANSSIRIIEHNLAIEHADYGTVLGNQATIQTYSYAKKPLFPVPVPTPQIYQSPEKKSFHDCKNRFLWFGSSGFVHKGLDLVLEAFVEMPNCHLTICGPVNKDTDFVQDFYTELYQTPNIHTVGWVDVSSSNFVEIANSCAALIYPSCAEGQAGSVVTCLQAGLIPIVSYESGVDVEDFGKILVESSLNEIKAAVGEISVLPEETLEIMSTKAWEYARKNHTKEDYLKRYTSIIHSIMNEQGINII